MEEELSTNFKGSMLDRMVEGPWRESDILKRILSAKETAFNSDLTVIVDDDILQCHSFILSISSPTLYEMIRENGNEIKLPGVKSRSFRQLLDTMYSGKSAKLQSNYNEILEVIRDAHKWKIYTAIPFCIKQIWNLLDAKCVCQILDLQEPCLMNFTSIKEACKKVIQSQTDEVLKSDGFLKCDVATLEFILKQEIVHNVTELDLFQALAAWAKERENPREALGSTLSLIRFGTFSSKEIAKNVKPTKLLTDAEENSLLWYLMAGGEGELPEGFNNDSRRRHMTSSIELIGSGKEEEVKIDSTGNNIFCSLEEYVSNSPLLIKLNEDAFLIGIKSTSHREDKKKGDRYTEIAELMLKDQEGKIITSTNFKEDVTYGVNYIVRFPLPILLFAEVTYALEFSSVVPNVRRWIRNVGKQICKTSTSLEIHLLEEAKQSIEQIIIAPNVE